MFILKITANKWRIDRIDNPELQHFNYLQRPSTGTNESFSTMLPQYFSTGTHLYCCVDRVKGKKKMNSFLAEVTRTWAFYTQSEDESDRAIQFPTKPL